MIQTAKESTISYKIGILSDLEPSNFGHSILFRICPGTGREISIFGFRALLIDTIGSDQSKAVPFIRYLRDPTLGAVSKFGFWFKVKEDPSFQPKEYWCISRTGNEYPTPRVIRLRAGGAKRQFRNSP
jgi:hypothetical protein